MNLQKAVNHETQASAFNSSRRNFLKIGGATLLAGGLSNALALQNAGAFDRLSEIRAQASGPINEGYWKFIRAQFPLEQGLIYMNNGTEGSIPRFVLSRIGEYFKEFAKNPWHAGVDDEYYNYFMGTTISDVAAFLGANADEIALTMNTTEGMSFIANGLDLQAGDEVLSTLHEHEAGTSGWYIKEDRQHIKFTQLVLPTPAATKEEIISAFENAITPATKVMSFCHINYTTGLRMPVKELCLLARQHGIVSVVDGAHAIGMLTFDLHDLGCDFYACSPHKWLCAPPGTGVLYIRKDAQGLLWPTSSLLYTKGKGIGADTTTLIFRGQMCTPAYKCLKDVIEFQSAIGRDRIQNRILELSSYLKGEIIKNWGADKIFSPLEESLSSGLVSFNPFADRFQPDPVKNVFYKLKDEHKIVIRRLWYKERLSERNTHTLRVSTQIYNNYSDIDILIAAIKEIIA
ncbi:MAG: aminotransferase class V-fold PLP-dependent enzyme [Pseudomonadota bacterium]